MDFLFGANLQHTPLPSGVLVVGTVISLSVRSFLNSVEKKEIKKYIALWSKKSAHLEISKDSN